ncbi:ribosomal protein S5 domain 2-type protein [Pisolithus croceorrhizus]|nr:ribosomal protein S5 domain 2-type protein [Pisolithus croceorrhizus]
MSVPIVVSAPGKALLAGGYLVLDPAYSGLVISVSSRFYTVIRDGAPSVRPNEIYVRSPQFIDATWKYTVTLKNDDVLVSESPHSSSNRNRFVHCALQLTLKLVSEWNPKDLAYLLSRGLDIAAVADNDFYTQKHEPGEARPSIASLSEKPPFCPLNVTLSDVQKTGMGSSAALITSIVSALLLKFGVISKEGFARRDGSDRVLAHNTAQLVHCLAQGKVGSGFDVSAAVFGSHIYTRFDPKILAPLMDATEDFSNFAHIPLRSVLDPRAAVGQDRPTWNSRVIPFQLPPLVRLVLADVAGGSSTPSLVRKVNEWRSKNAQDAKQLWTSIDLSNKSLVDSLRELSSLYLADTEAYEAAVHGLTFLPPSEWAEVGTSGAQRAVTQALYGVYQAGQATRALMRKMGENAGVDIEPPTQTELLNQSIAQAGVIAGGVPGAGGDDAIWVLVLESKDALEAPLHRIEQVWRNFKQRTVTPLLATQSMEIGARVEELADVRGLERAITTEDYAKSPAKLL